MTTTWRMRIACWIPKAIDAYSENVILVFVFQSNNGGTNVFQCYVTRTLPVLLLLDLMVTTEVFGPGLLSRYGDWVRAGQSGDRIPVGARFSSPVKTGPGSYPVSCTMGTGSFPGVKSGRGVTLNPHPLLVVMKE
jgi:hypothetical protein